MPLRNARRDISKFKPSIAIMKEIPQRFPTLLQQVQILITKSVWYSRQKLYFNTEAIFQEERNIIEDKKYILRQKLFSNTKVIFQDKRIRASSKVVGIPLTQCWRFPRFAFSGISPNILSPVQVAKDHEFTILVEWEDAFSENLEFFELLIMFSPRISYKP